MKSKKVRKRRKLSGEKKYSILDEIKNSPKDKAEILRREGLYSSDIQRFEEAARAASIKALNASRPGPRKLQEVPVRDYEAIQRELARKEKALAELSVEFTILKKKVNGE